MSKLFGRTQARVAPTAKTAVQASAGLKLLARMLTLNVEELERLVQQELEENPALEPTEEGTPFERYTLSFTVAHHEPEESGEETTYTDPEEDFEPEVAAPPMSLKEHVWGQLMLTVAPHQKPIAEFLVDSLDHRGYLTTSVEEVALRFNCSLEEVEAVVQQLQQCDPPGVGARSLQECLQLQIKALRNYSDPELLELAWCAVTEGWEHLTRARYEKLMRRLHIDKPTLERVLAFIRNELAPYPAAGFAEFEEKPPELSPREPDVVVSLSQNGFHVEIHGYKPHFLKLSPTYYNRFMELRQGEIYATEEENTHLRHFLKRAQVFIQALQQREQTLKKIMHALIQKQTSFFFTSDVRFLQPMTRAELAEMTGLHRSTIGRAVRNKWLQLPNRSVVPMDIFFDNAYRVAALIRQLIDEHERDGVLLTDAEIATKLEEMGIPIARRTVTKYRAKYRIFSSRWRERARKAG